MEKQNIVFEGFYLSLGALLGFTIYKLLVAIAGLVVALII